MESSKSNLKQSDRHKWWRWKTEILKETGTDLWATKRTNSFIPCSKFMQLYCKTEHILLAFNQVADPHSAQSVKACVSKCMQEWNIPMGNILSVITNNGENMVAAFQHTTAERRRIELWRRLPHDGRLAWVWNWWWHSVIHFLCYYSFRSPPVITWIDWLELSALYL